MQWRNFSNIFKERSSENPNEFKVIVLDNGAFHKGKTLEIPKNIALVFLLPYSPKLNPAELVWLNMKRKLTNKIFKTMDDLIPIMIVK